jgi:hypothetical protein
MDVMNVTKQMVAFQKQSMNSFQGIWDLAQAQTSSTVDRLMDHNAWIPRKVAKPLTNGVR